MVNEGGTVYKLKPGAKGRSHQQEAKEEVCKATRFGEARPYLPRCYFYYYTPSPPTP
ncbi:hypothetical protein NC652_024511 [Populus alba x Populus x berolinensis]|nr:hypothetical protein NC652_024511 [Populus alba x Populus x berolinensis]